MTSSTPTPKKLFGFIFIILWVTLGVTLYAYGHRPFEATFALKTIQNIWALGASFWLIALAGALGQHVLKNMASPSLAQASLQAAIGVAISSILIFIYGSIFSITPLLLWIVLLLATAVLRKEIASWTQNIFSVWRTIWSAGRYEKIIWSAVVLLLSLTLFKSLAPPLAYDAQVYHLVLPLRHLAAGKILIYDDLLFSGFPQMLHMQYLWLYALGVQAPAVFSWWIGVLAITTIWQAAKTWFSSAAAATAIAALLTSYTMIDALTTAYVDWAGIWIGILALIVFVHWSEHEGTYDLILLGVLSGIAMGYKYTFGVLFVFIFMGIFWHSRKEPKIMVKQILWVGFSAALVASPWLFKNWLVTGNPIYPLLFPAGAMTPLRLSLYATANDQLAWYDIAFIPFRATFWGIHKGTLGNAPNFQGEIGPLLLLLGSISLLGFTKNKQSTQQYAIHSAAVFSLTGIALWALATTVAAYLIFPRHYYVMFPAFAILAGYGFETTKQYNLFEVRVQRLIMALVILSFGFTTITYTLDALEEETLQVVTGIKSEQSYLFEQLGLQVLMSEHITNEYGQGEVLLLWETRSYYCAPACIPDDNANYWIYTWQTMQDTEAILNNWQDQGIKYILVRHGAIDYVWTKTEQSQRAELIALNQLLDTLTIEENFNDVYILYRLP